MTTNVGFREEKTPSGGLVTGLLAAIERTARKQGRGTRRRTARERIDTVATTLSETLLARDPVTGEHSKRVAELAEGFGRFLQLPRNEIHSLYLAGLLHDIGKVGIRDDVLFKPGTLTPEEHQRIREHPRIAERILSPLGCEEVVRYIAVHHENVDGSGYPEGLSGEEIPLGGRILAVVDTYDALRSWRPYKEAFVSAEIRKIMTEMAGAKLDPRLLETFWGFLSGFPAAARTRGEGEDDHARSHEPPTAARETGRPDLGRVGRWTAWKDLSVLSRFVPHRGRPPSPLLRPEPIHALLPYGNTCST